MKAQIQKYKPKTRLPISVSDIVNVEMVLRRHIMREFKDRNVHPFIKPLQRLDVRDAIKALRSIRNQEMEFSNV